MAMTAVRRLATAAVVLNVVLVATGAAVRLTGSGLGCPTWPRCTAESLTNTPELGIHGYIEFGNRLLGVVLEVLTLVLLVVLFRLRARVPRSWVLLALVLALVVPAQAVVGGLLVLTGLNPYVLIVHFLVSFPLILAAVALRNRVQGGPGPRVPLVRRELRVLTGTLLTVSALVLVAGALVTGTGPHAGSADVPRLPFELAAVTQVHADLVFVLIGLTVAAAMTARAVDAPVPVRRAATTLVGLLVVQGILGYVQYATGLPAAVVQFHVLGAALVFATAAAAHIRTSGPAPAPDGSSIRAAAAATPS